MIKKESLPNLAGPTQILPVNVRGPALILKTADDFREHCDIAKLNDLNV